MSFAAPWAFAGLALAIPLVLAHLRRRRPRVRDVPSLLAWRRSQAPVGASTRRLGNPAHPWLLALQLLALVLFVVALAKPHTGGSSPGPTRAFVVDDSIWMGASEGGGTRLEAAQSTLRDELDALPGDERVALILAGAESRLLYEGSAGDAAGAVARIRPTFGPADLGAALRLAAGLPRDGGGVELLRAPEDAGAADRRRRGAFQRTGGRAARSPTRGSPSRAPVASAAPRPLRALRPGREHGDRAARRPGRGAGRRQARSAPRR